MRKILSKVALAATALVGASTSANAYVLLQIADLTLANVTQTIVSCNTSQAQNNVAGGNCSTVDGFLDYSLGTNSIKFDGTVGSFAVDTTSGVGNQPGTSFASLNTSSTDVANTAAAGSGLDRLYINFVGFDFLFPAGTAKTVRGTASYSGTEITSGPAGLGNIETFFYADGNNTGAAANGQSCNMNLTFLPGAGGCDTGLPMTWNDPAVPAGFALRTQQYFTINGQTVVNSTTSVIARNVPEPVSTSLVGLGLLGLALASRRKAKAA